MIRYAHASPDSTDAPQTRLAMAQLRAVMRQASSVQDSRTILMCHAALRGDDQAMQWCVDARDVYTRCYPEFAELDRTRAGHATSGRRPGMFWIDVAPIVAALIVVAAMMVASAVLLDAG